MQIPLNTVPHASLEALIISHIIRSCCRSRVLLNSNLFRFVLAARAITALQYSILMREVSLYANLGRVRDRNGAARPMHPIKKPVDFKNHSVDVINSLCGSPNLIV